MLIETRDSRADALQTSSVTVTSSGKGKSVTASRYLITVTLVGNKGFAKTVTVTGLTVAGVTVPEYACTHVLQTLQLKKQEVRAQVSNCNGDRKERQKRE